MKYERYDPIGKESRRFLVYFTSFIIGLGIANNLYNNFCQKESKVSLNTESEKKQKESDLEILLSADEEKINKLIDSKVDEKYRIYKYE